MRLGLRPPSASFPGVGSRWGWYFTPLQGRHLWRTLKFKHKRAMSRLRDGCSGHRGGWAGWSQRAWVQTLAPPHRLCDLRPAALAVWPWVPHRLDRDAYDAYRTGLV